MRTITVVPGTVRTDPGIEGLEVSDGEWRLDVDRYREFITEATGISPSGGLSATDCYRIGNRLGALLEEHRQAGEWGPALVDAYPDIESLGEFLWVARFFRACHDCHDAGETCLPAPEHGRTDPVSQ